MDTTVQATAFSGSRKRRPNYSIDFKLRLAQQACAPGVSVSRLALEHGINASVAAYPRSLATLEYTFDKSAENFYRSCNTL